MHLLHEEWPCCDKRLIRNWAFFVSFLILFSHVLILLNIVKDLSVVAEVTPAVKVILMKVTQFLINMIFSRDNDFNTSTTYSKLVDSHSKIVGSSWSSEVECVSSTFNSSVTSCLPTAFKNNCSAWVNNLNVGWSNLSFMALTVESRAS